MLFPFQSPLFVTACFKQNRTRLDDFHLDSSRYYVFFLIVSPASIVDKTSFINQSAAILAPFFINRAELPSAPENNRGGG
tara:strand:- start:592 stop:831 length:240 start_codon:yes stop_codon:yes gene_type:complete